MSLFLIMNTGSFTIVKSKAQTTNISSTFSSNRLSSNKKVVNKNGWDIPGLKSFNVLPETEEVEVDSIKVKKKIFRSSEEPITKLELYSVDENGTIHVSSITCAVRHLFAYEFNNKLFAYQTILIVTNVLSNKTRVYMGAAYSLFYYDEDGDGLFETRIGASMLQEIPEWSKADKK